jgi:CMP-N,N'-diacetyllegionaminic acid synthase
MISGSSVVAIICARGGSKGLVRKNVLEVGGRPMIAWSVDAALSAPSIDRTILTSDDAEIIAAAKEAGCDVPFVRPAHLATDTSSVHDAIIHALDSLDKPYDVLVLLQATSPFRQASDIENCLALIARGAPASMSVVAATKPLDWLHEIDAEGKLRRMFKRVSKVDHRQNAPTYYYPNGAVYAANVAWYRRHMNFSSAETLAYVMPPERSIDIDSPLDYAYAKALLDSGLVTLSNPEVRHVIRA